MQTVKCPSCEAKIPVVVEADLKEMGIAHNSRREDPSFPKPILDYRNRHIWLLEDIDRYLLGRTRRSIDKKIDKTIAPAIRAIERMPEDERDAGFERLREQLGSDIVSKIMRSWTQPLGHENGSGPAAEDLPSPTPLRPRRKKG